MWTAIPKPKITGNTPKTQKFSECNKLLKTKGIVNINIRVTVGGACFLHLACQRGGLHPCRPVSYATDQVHFKHEQPQVLSPDSNVKSVRFSKYRTQSACFDYIDTIVGMRLDQRSN